MKKESRVVIKRLLLVPLVERQHLAYDSEPAKVYNSEHLDDWIESEQAIFNHLSPFTRDELIAELIKEGAVTKGLKQTIKQVMRAPSSTGGES